MSNTVAASVIVAWLGDIGPSFIPAQSSPSSGAANSVSGALHVVGGASVSEPTSGFGSPLLVDFVSFGASPTPSAGLSDPSPSVPGHAGALSPLDVGPALPGGMFHSS